MKYKAWVLPLFLIGSLSAIYFLPKVGDIAQSAVNMALPHECGEWVFRPQAASQLEIDTLSKDTEFAKAICLSARPGEFNPEGYIIPDRVDLSIVLSGADINNSIHRPERCMPAQGHQITSSRSDVLKPSNGRDFPVKRLVSKQTASVLDSSGVPMKDSSGLPLKTKYNCITYYFFVGHDHVSNDHLGRTIIDMKDRLVRGMDQRWAYISVSMLYGKVPLIEKEVSEAEADGKLRQFLTDFSERQIDWKQIAL